MHERPAALQGTHLFLWQVQMSVELAQEHLTWNAEAVERCTVLSTGGFCPAHVRLLFASGAQQPPNSCLLHQMSRLILAGLAASVDACVRASEAQYGAASAGSAVRSAIAKAASTVGCHAWQDPCVMLPLPQCHVQDSFCLTWHHIPIFCLLCAVQNDVLPSVVNCMAVNLWSWHPTHFCRI